MSIPNPIAVTTAVSAGGFLDSFQSQGIGVLAEAITYLAVLAVKGNDKEFALAGGG